MPGLPARRPARRPDRGRPRAPPCRLRPPSVVKPGDEGLMTTYPRIVPGVLLAPAEDGYVVQGGPRRDRFGGQLVTELFPRLLPLLDGTRPDDGLAAALGQPDGQITRILNA